MIYLPLLLVSEPQSFFQWSFGIVISIVVGLVGYAIRNLKKEIDDMKQETSLMQTRINTLETNIMEKLSAIEKSITRLETLSTLDRPTLVCQKWAKEAINEAIKK